MRRGRGTRGDMKTNPSRGRRIASLTMVGALTLGVAACSDDDGDPDDIDNPVDGVDDNLDDMNDGTDLDIDIDGSNP